MCTEQTSVACWTLCTRFRQFQQKGISVIRRRCWVKRSGVDSAIQINLMLLNVNSPHHPKQELVDHDLCMVHSHASTVWITAYKSALDKFVWFYRTDFIEQILLPIKIPNRLGNAYKWVRCSVIHILLAILLSVIVLAQWYCWRYIFMYHNVHTIQAQN